ncbi:MAG: polyphenol oxidase family protein [Pseudobdellovibrionaceae bacterium]|uniref:polyphenol oxidase family protein n=1 Tax=Oligoflexus sp. TaxID=1971216 RepID=UPI0027C855BE|nr:polyphenol oxidase family protein [Oligoflexus sp.]MDQ3231308.1 polyphenol oxidase family protein [Pseudobdellovibrionaceae bacterium]HYX39028.1 polyphenol oxidase family protein [Oligoflexus sp.]
MNPIESWINRMTWTGTEHQLPLWVENGVAHGFEGLGYELPKTGYSLKQVHGTRLIEVKSGADASLFPEADGLWTREPGHIIAVKTADCVPILIHHPQLVMAIHAGWKGMAQDIIGVALQVLDRQGLALKDCRIGIGPCISLDSFEVGPEVMEQFRRSPYRMDDETLAWCSSKGQGDRWHLDLGLLTALRFKRAGLQPEQLSVIRSCTRKNPMIWHSFRRDDQRAGRNWSWIRL